MKFEMKLNMVLPEPVEAVREAGSIVLKTASY
jgi:hypothetical protein